MGQRLIARPTLTAGVAPGQTWRSLALGAANAAVLPVAGLATYRRWIDGPWPAFAAAMALAFLAGLLVASCWTWTVRLPRWAWLGLPLAVLVSAPAPAVHVARVLSRGVVVGGTLGAPVEYGRAVTPVLQGDSAFSIAGEAIALRVPAGSTGFLELRWQPDAGSAWRLPRALIEPGDPQQQEEIAWRASVERDGPYFMLVEAGRVSVQVTEFGLLVTAPDSRGDLKGEGVAVPVPDGRFVDWALRRADGRVRLLAAGREVWSGPDTGGLVPARLGETRTDRDHGGTLRVTALSFGRRLVRAADGRSPAGANVSASANTGANVSASANGNAEQEGAALS